MKFILKKQPIQQQQKFKQHNCPSFKRNNWLDFDKGYYCQNFEFTINKQKHQINKKVLRNCQYFSTILNYANKKLERYIILWLILLTLQHMT